MMLMPGEESLIEAAAPVEGCEILHIDVDEAQRLLGFEALRGWRLYSGLGRDPMAFEAAVQGGAGNVRAQAPAHDLEDVVEGDCRPHPSPTRAGR